MSATFSAIVVYILVSFGNFKIVKNEVVDCDIHILDPRSTHGSDAIVQGDILVEKAARFERQIMKSINYWNPNKAISYVFSPQFNEKQKDLIRHVLGTYSALTCLQFSENTTNYPVVNFVKQGGCFSIMGRVLRSKSQILSLADHCLSSHLILMHEIGHLLGVIHEHSRPDRDSYIKIHPENSIKKNKFNFEKLSSRKAHMLVPYDYSSFMHYNNHAFTSNGDKTIDSVNEMYERTMGNAVYASASVFKAINLFYRCNNRCKNTQINCLHSGYQNPNDCTKCNCAEGFGGQRCEKLAEPFDTTSCGARVEASPEWKTINATLTRTLTEPLPYASVCYYHITAPQNATLVIKLKDLHMNCSTSCSVNNLMINMGPDWTVGAMRFCCAVDVDRFNQFERKTELAVLGLYSWTSDVHFVIDYKIQ